MRAEAVLMPVYGQDYIKSKDVVFPRGEVPKKEYKPLILCVDTQARCLGARFIGARGPLGAHLPLPDCHLPDGQRNQEV